MRIRATAQPAQLGLCRGRRRAEFGGRSEPARIGVLDKPAQRVDPVGNRSPPIFSSAQADQHQPGHHLLVGRAVNPFLDDGCDGAVMTAAPRSFGEAAEHQPVDSPVAQPERVRPHDLEAVAGTPEITAVDVEHRPDRQLHDPIDTLRIETTEEVVGLGPATELMAVAGGDGVEHTGEHRHRRRPRRRRVGDHRLHEVGCAALGDDETPEVPVDPGSVGDITAAHGDVEGVAQLGEPAGEITGGRQGDAEGVPGMSLVAR